MEKAAHYGVYAVIIDDLNQLTAVRKTRGPYAGLYDLPGGAPEPGESVEETLKRELLEEIGAEVSLDSKWQDLKFIVSMDSKGNAIHFTHTAKIVGASVVKTDITKRLEVDTDQVAKISVEDFENNKIFSALVKNALCLIR